MGSGTEAFTDNTQAYSVEMEEAASENSYHVEPRRFSRLQLVQVGVMIFFMGVQLTLPYTISVYMVRDFFKEGDHSEQKIAQLTGILAASQSIFRTLSAYAWGIIVDRLGRKVGALSGVFASVVSLVFYGAATGYVQALIARSIPALLISAVPVAMKAMIGDTCDEKGQAIALGVFNVGHGLGSTVGPLLGGLLAHPCERFSSLPYCGSQQILETRPFLLPCLAGAIFGVIAFLVACLLMKETLPELSDQPGGWKANFLRVMCCKGAHGYASIDQDEVEAKDHSELRKLQSDVEMGSLKNIKATQGESANTDVPDLSIRMAQAEEADTADVGQALALLKEDPEGPKGSLESKASQDSEKWWKDRDTVLALIGSGLAAFFYNFFDEMAPIYVSAPVKEGGLAMPLTTYTFPLATAGAVLIVFSLFVYPWMVDKYSPLVLCKFGMVAIAPMALLLPFASIVRSSYIAQQVLVYLAITSATIPKTCALGSSMVVINLVASKSAMGRINGAGVTLQSMGRALGPSLSGTAWAISVSLHIYGQQFLGFILCMIGCVASQFIFAGIQVPNSTV